MLPLSCFTRTPVQSPQSDQLIPPHAASSPTSGACSSLVRHALQSAQGFALQMLRRLDCRLCMPDEELQAPAPYEPLSTSGSETVMPAAPTEQEIPAEPVVLDASVALAQPCVLTGPPALVESGQDGPALLVEGPASVDPHPPEEWARKTVGFAERFTEYPPKPTLVLDPSVCTFRTLHLLPSDAHAASFAASVGEHGYWLQANDENWKEKTFSYANGLNRLQIHMSELKDYHAVVKEFQEGFQTCTTSSGNNQTEIAAIQQELAEKLQMLEREEAHIDDLIHAHKTTVTAQNNRIDQTKAERSNDLINRQMVSTPSSGESDDDEKIHFGEMLHYANGGGASIIQQLHADLEPLVRSFEKFGSLFNRARSDSIEQQRMAENIVTGMGRMLTLLQSRLTDYRLEGGRNKDFVGWMNDKIDSLTLERRMWEARAKRVSNFLSAPSSALVQPTRPARVALTRPPESRLGNG